MKIIDFQERKSHMVVIKAATNNNIMNFIINDEAKEKKKTE